MKKPYIRKFRDVGAFSVWIVDGKYVRSYIDEEFTNFGQHFRFKFIPKNEFWIDKENSGDESRFFIDHLLLENSLMKSGVKYKKAIETADLKEKKERSKSSFYKRNVKLERKHDKKLIKRIHKSLLRRYSNERIKVWVVNGELVRDLFFIDFTEGGHDKVYKFVPMNEIWIDDDLSKEELKFVLLHELHERNLMSKGEKYEKAHYSASEIEYHCRHHPKEIDKKLKEEMLK